MILPRRIARHLLAMLGCVLFLSGCPSSFEVSVVVDSTAYPIRKFEVTKIEVAPMSDVVVSFKITRDEVAATGTVLIDDTEVNVSSHTFRAVEPGQKVKVRVESKDEYLEGYIQFVAKSAELTVSSTGDGTVELNDTVIEAGVPQAVRPNEPIRLSVTEDSAGRFIRWSGACLAHATEGDAESETLVLMFQPEEVVSCAAEFDTLKSLLVKLDATDGSAAPGKVMIELPDRAEECRDVCSHDVDPRTSLHLVAVPSVGYDFVSWSSSDCAAFGSAEGGMVTADVECTATFEPEEVTTTCNDTFVDFGTADDNGYHSISFSRALLFEVGARPDQGPTTLEYSFVYDGQTENWTNYPVERGEPASVLIPDEIERGQRYELKLRGTHDECGALAAPEAFGPLTFKLVADRQ